MLIITIFYHCYNDQWQELWHAFTMFFYLIPLILEEMVTVLVCVHVCVNRWESLDSEDLARNLYGSILTQLTRKPLWSPPSVKNVVMKGQKVGKPCLCVCFLLGRCCQELLFGTSIPAAFVGFPRKDIRRLEDGMRAPSISGRKGDKGEQYLQ